MRMVFRILAALFLALALVLLVADGTAMLAANAFIATPLAATIASVFPGRLEALQESLHPLLWEPALTTLLSWPGWAVIGVVGLGLALLGRSRTRRRMVHLDSY